MSLCRLAVGAFMWGWPRDGYDAGDLTFGVSYARGLIEEGYTTEPFYEFDLGEFEEWCKRESHDSSMQRCHTCGCSERGELADRISPVSKEVHYETPTLCVTCAGYERHPDTPIEDICRTCGEPHCEERCWY